MTMEHFAVIYSNKFEVFLKLFFANRRSWTAFAEILDIGEGSCYDRNMAYIYIVRCADNSLYTGITKDLGQRMRTHYYKEKNGAKYTRSRQVQALEMVWETQDWADAAKLEIRIKRLRHADKEALIACPESVPERFGESLEGISYTPHPEFRLEQFIGR